MVDGIEMAVQQLITKVESSQSLIDDLEAQILDLRLELQAQEIQHTKRLEEKDADFAAVVAPRLQALQEDLEQQEIQYKKRLEEQEIQHTKRLEEKDADFAAVVAPRLQKLQEELDYYYSLSRKQFELIKAAEDLQARASRLLLGSDQ